jgi:phosphoglycolate phosphatase-like HAD superfamily hydrolase
MNQLEVLAFDFDGVICDGLKEYFQTAWKAYCQIWKLDNLPPDEHLAPQFYRLRPVVETGWEMPVVLRALELGFQEEDIFQNWTAITAQIVTNDNLNSLKISRTVDGIRDQWIAQDLESWLVEHEFYPGVIDRLQSILSSSIEVFIISTKEGRFIQKLLQKQGVNLSEDRIYGKEKKRPKYQILQELKQSFGDTVTIWFIEDRLKTLQAVKHQDALQDVELFLADWGYNTASERDDAKNDDRIHLISLGQFGQDSASWL